MESQPRRQDIKTDTANKAVPKRLYTLQEAAIYLGRGLYGMRELVWSGEIPVVKGNNGRKIYVDIMDLDNYIERNKSVYC
jgi:excisionase family DNA binding protein